MRSTQIPLFTPETEWVMPDELKDLRGAKEIAIDLETNDPHLKELRKKKPSFEESFFANRRKK